jgi:hypothetical protein
LVGIDEDNADAGRDLTSSEVYINQTKKVN